MTTLFSRATVALAMSESDAEVLRYAVLLGQSGIVHEFHFVHVLTPPHRGDDPDARRRLQERLTAEMESRIAELPRECSTTCHVLEGIRIDSLVEFVTDHQSDLIVLGHRVQRSGRRSLAKRLAMITTSSVWMVPEGAPVHIRNILAPVDFSKNSADSLSMATAVARNQGIAECLSLHVYFDPSTIRYDEHVSEVRGNEKRDFAEFLETVETYGVTVEPCFEESSKVANAILRNIEKHDIDLVVMSTRGRSRAASILLGSATSQVITETPVPILVVKHFGARLNLFQVLRSEDLWERKNPKSN